MRMYNECICCYKLYKTWYNGTYVHLCMYNVHSMFEHCTMYIVHSMYVQCTLYILCLYMFVLEIPKS